METEVNSFLTNLEIEPAYSKSTQMAYASDLRAFLRFLHSSQGYLPKPTDLNTDRVAAFLESERQIGRSRSTLVRRVATLKNFREFMAGKGIITKEAFAVDDPKIQSIISAVPKRISQRCLTPDEINSLLTCMESSPRPRSLRDQAILMFLLETGLPVSELTELDMSDLDLRSGRFHVNLVGKGDLWLALGEAKYSVELYIQDGRPNLVHQPGEPALFISQMNGRLSRQGIWQILNYWGQLVNPPLSLSPRILRNTAVLRMIKAGISGADIQIRLGHSNPLSTKALIRRLENSCL